MNEKETSKDIIAEMRTKAECAKPYDDGIVMMLTDYADRLEAAHKRESESITPKSDPDWKDICAKCKDGDIEPKHCEYYGEPNGCNSPIYGEHPIAEKSSAVGDCAKLRDALKNCALYIRLVAECGIGVVTINDKHQLDPEKLVKAATAALAAPPRNCDAGAAEDQTRRYEDYCRAHTKVGGCTGCPLVGCRRCQIAWMRLPYMEKEGVAK